MKTPRGADLLEVVDLSTYFFTRRGVVKAVDKVSFRVGVGETLGLVGESGCGKSMTCLSLLRLVPQPAGKIVGGKVLLEGEDLLKKSEAEMRGVRGKRISIILQDPMASLDPSFTIGSQVIEAIGTHQRGVKSWFRERAVELLRRVRIPSPEVRMGNYPHQLSGGMRQRVVGAMALSCQPHLLLADEPTTSLDATIQVQYLRLLKEVQEATSLSIIFVTHDFGIIARTCDRVAVMYAGKIVEMAKVKELFAYPLHCYTIALMNSVPKVSAIKERLPTIEGEPPLLHALPPGCGFSPRCPSRETVCEEPPPNVIVGDGHMVACWRYA